MSEKAKIGVTPEEMQIDLRRVYFSLPKRDAVIPDFVDFNSMSLDEKGKYHDRMANEEDRRMQSELTTRQIELLDELLKRARITDVLKQGIFENFEDYFREGVTAEDISIIHSLGVGDEGFLQQGIFSDDPAVRIGIEATYYRDLLDDYYFFIDNPDEYVGDPDMEKEVTSKREGIELFEFQFFQIYDTPISQVPVI